MLLDFFRRLCEPEPGGHFDLLVVIYRNISWAGKENGNHYLRSRV